MVFFGCRKEDEKSFIFLRQDLDWAASHPRIIAILGKRIANLGDILYSFRFRRSLPQSILDTQQEGLQWRIRLAGRGTYRFSLSRSLHIEPNESLITIKVPDATPEIISKYALTDEQALLAKVRYNRLIDTFLGVTTYSLQNHLRTSVDGIGQIEVDELYVGIDRNGRHYIIPVQAKGGNDKLSPAQAEQDIAFCGEKFPDLQCRAVNAQFLEDGVIALLEVAICDDEIRTVEEKHYMLVPARDCSPKGGAA